MARYFDVHPVNPQPRAIAQIGEILRRGGVIAYPTDSCYALGCTMSNKKGQDRIREIRELDERHHFTMMCRDFSQLGKLADVDNSTFRAIKAATPGEYTFILRAELDLPRKLQNPKKRTVGVRIPNHPVALALLDELGEPMQSSTLLLPDRAEAMTQGWEIKERLDDLVDAVIDAGECGTTPTTVIDFSDGYAEIVRAGAGDPARFE